MTSSRKRHWFRFGLRTLLVLPVLVGCIWWWCTWPERTARRFVASLSEGKVEAAQKMLRSPPKLPSTERETPGFDIWNYASSQGEFSFFRPTIRRRGISDFLAGRGNFSIRAEHVKGLADIYFGDFTASRGYVQRLNEGDTKMPVHYFELRNTNVESVLAKLQTVFSPTSPIKLIIDEQRNRIFFQGDEQTCVGLNQLLKEFDKKDESLNPSEESKQ